MTLLSIAVKIRRRLVTELRPQSLRGAGACTPPGRADYHRQFEAILYGRKAGSQHY